MGKQHKHQRLNVAWAVCVHGGHFVPSLAWIMIFIICNDICQAANLSTVAQALDFILPKQSLCATMPNFIEVLLL